MCTCRSCSGLFCCATWALALSRHPIPRGRVGAARGAAQRSAGQPTCMGVAGRLEPRQAVQHRQPVLSLKAGLCIDRLEPDQVIQHV